MNLPPVFILFLGYGTLFLIGLGPAIWFISRQNPRRIPLAMCVAPVVGLGETGLLFYPLTYYSLPIGKTAFPIIVLLVTLSIGLLIYDIQHHPKAYQQIASQRTIFLVGASFTLSLFLLFLSPLLGGPQTQFWQASPWDATSYMKMAEYAKDIPISYSQTLGDYQDAFQVNPALALIPGLMASRPAAPDTLAWLSTLYGIPIYTGYYFLKLLFIALIFGMVLAIGLRLKMPIHWCVACAIVLTVGFWTIWVADIDALSETSALSLNLLVFFALLCLEQATINRLLSRQRFFLGFALASAMVFYPESFWLVAVAVVFYILLRIVYLIGQWKAIVQFLAGFFCTGIIAIVFQLPDLNITLHFMLSQANVASTNLDADWPAFYFSWLNSGGAPLRDLWGLSFIQLTNFTFLGHGLAIFTSLIGLMLLSALIIGFRHTLSCRKMPSEYKIVAAFSLAFWGAGLGELLRQQIWVADKMLSMGFPFIVIALFFYTMRLNTILSWRVKRVVVVSLVIWFVLQTITPVLHALEATRPTTYPLYTDIFASDKFPTADIESAITSLKTHPPTLLGTDFTNLTTQDSYFDPRDPLWTLAVADKTKIEALGGQGLYINWPPIVWQNSDTVPDQLLLSTQRDFLSPQHLGHPLVDHPPLFVLSAVTPEELDQAVMFPAITDPGSIAAIAITDSSYLPNNQGQSVRWTLQRNFPGVPNPEQTFLRFWASGKMLFSLYLRYQPNFKGGLGITTNGSAVVQQSFSSADSQQTVFCVGKPGINTITLNYTVNSLLNIGSSNQRLLLEEALFAPNGRVDVGIQAEQSLVGSGWYPPEQWDTSRVRWSGQESQLTLLTCKPPSRLHFRAFVPPSKTNNVTLTLNGTLLGSVALQEGWHEYSLPIPPGVYQENGKQILSLNHATAEVPINDTRALSAAYEWISLDESGIQGNHANGQK